MLYKIKLSTWLLSLISNLPYYRSTHPQASDQTSNMADTVTELEPESQSYIDLSKESGPIDLTLPVEQIREITGKVCEKLKGDFEFTGTRDDREVSAIDANGVSYDIPVTVLKGELESGSEWGNIMVYFHGGGWTWGSRQSHMAFCEMIAR